MWGTNQTEIAFFLPARIEAVVWWPGRELNPDQQPFGAGFRVYPPFQSKIKFVIGRASFVITL